AAFLAMIAEAQVGGAPPRGVAFAGIALFTAAKAVKWWAILTLGPFWAFRVLVVPGASLVATRPYRSLRHPNHVGVIGELAAVGLVCLLFVALAAIVSMSGGFRLHIGGWRIAVTSPYPLLLWALAIGVVRRFSAPTVPIYRDLPPRVIGWWRRPGVSTAATVI